MVAVVRRSSFDCCQGGSRKACVCRETLRACDEAITSRRARQRTRDSRRPFVGFKAGRLKACRYIGGKKLSGSDEEAYAYESIGIDVRTLGLNLYTCATLVIRLQHIRLNPSWSLAP
jgi:hypothetical protein